MNRAHAAAALRDLAIHLGATADCSEWHLFGSVDRNEPKASDIDLMILCVDASQANGLRQAIDPDVLSLPLHLSLLTYDEAMQIDVVRLQRSTKIYP